MERSEVLSLEHVFFIPESPEDNVLFAQLEEEGELIYVSPHLYYRDASPASQNEALSALLPPGWGYTGLSAANLLGASTEVPTVTEVAVPRTCSLPENVSSQVKANRYGRNLLSPIEVSVLEVLESYPRFAECSMPELITKCRQALRSSESARLISCTVNEPKVVRDRLITVLSS
ncbi:MAG: hypothetical protein H9W81_08410 [Enterococcus sp.]|nr:hypothetical protein [Enterococcus sp.]